MPESRGVIVGAWVALDADCPITYVTHDDMAELLFGGPSGPVTLAASTDALDALVTTVSAVLHTLRGQPATSEISVRRPPTPSGCG